MRNLHNYDHEPYVVVFKFNMMYTIGMYEHSVLDVHK